MSCRKCGRNSPPDAAFCSGCGRRLLETDLLDERFKTPLRYTPQPLVRRVLEARPSIEGERKTVTALFVDVVGSTGIAERLGAEETADLLRVLFDSVLDEIHRHDGIVTQFLGDGFLALFGAPLSLENHAELGVRAAWAIQRDRRRTASARAESGPVEIQLRMGLHTGPVVVGEIADSLQMEYTAVGDTLNTAARLEALCEPGEILVTEETRALLTPAINTERVGVRSVRGREQQVVIHRVSGVGSHARRGPSRPEHLIGAPTVGREEEHATLLRALRQLGSGRGGLVTVSGDAGVGKSRLVAEARQRQHEGKVEWLEGRTLSFGQAMPYWPFLEVLRAWAGIEENDGETVRWAKLEARAKLSFGSEAGEILPYVATMMGLSLPADLVTKIAYLDSRSMGAQINRSVTRLVERTAVEHPLVLVFEDLHWADASSRDLLTHLVPVSKRAPLLLIGVGRPSDDEALRQLANAALEGGQAPVEIQLAPLPGDQATALLAELVGHRDLGSEIEHALLSRADGNPFFMEELVRSLVAHRQLVRDSGGRLVPTNPKLELNMPTTVHGVIMARIDRMEHELKELLRTASVVGRAFLLRVVDAISDGPSTEVENDLAGLLSLELIRERRLEPEVEFVFKHALVHEATYESILERRRRDLHSRVADSIERLFADRLEEFFGLLAHHHARAENWEETERFLRLAADEAGRVAANREALDLYRQALALFGDRWSAAEKARVERRMGEALFSLGRHTEAAEHMRDSFSLLGSPYPKSSMSLGLGLTKELATQIRRRLLRLGRRPSRDHSHLGERVRAYQTMGWMDYFEDPMRLTFDAFAMLNEAERAGDKAGIAMGSSMSGLALAHIPLPRTAERYFARALEAAGASGHPVALGDAHFQFAMHRHFRGDWEVALEHYAAGESPYREGGHIRGWGACLTLKAWVLRLKGDFRGALREIDRMGDVATETGDQQLIAWHEHTWGHVLWRAGNTVEAARRLSRAIEAHRAIPCTISLTLALADLAECLRRDRRHDEALALLTESEELIKERRFRGAVVWVPPVVSAQTQLDIAEHEHGAARREALRAARRACRRAMRAGRVAREGMPAAMRVRGTFEWIRGRERRARSLWLGSLAEADRLGARYEAAMTELEAGRRLDDVHQYEQGAERLGGIVAETNGLAS